MEPILDYLQNLSSRELEIVQHKIAVMLKQRDRKISNQYRDASKHHLLMSGYSPNENRRKSTPNCIDSDGM